MNNLPKISTNRKRRVICIPIDEKEYNQIILEAKKFRGLLQVLILAHKELFPKEIENGYLMKEIRLSKKESVLIRRIKVKKTNISYTIRPSFVMPYMAGRVKDVKTALFMRKFSVPFWALTQAFGRNNMYWYRLFVSFGRLNVVASTVKTKEIPKDLSADEKHSKQCGEKVYIPVTVANDCILGASVTTSASTEMLKLGYGDFKNDVLQANPEYTPKTVNTDGWRATHGAWNYLFSSITIIFCFLHLYIKIRDRCKKKNKNIFEKVSDRFWLCFDAKSQGSFSQRVRRLHEWAHQNIKIKIICERLDKLRKNLSSYSCAYKQPSGHRTSTSVDRVIKRMDRYLFNMMYFHGSQTASRLHIRAWAIFHNFWLFNPATRRKHNGQICFAEKFNGVRYHDCWLQNLLISSSVDCSP
jgi:hypothetical protein